MDVFALLSSILLAILLVVYIVFLTFTIKYSRLNKESRDVYFIFFFVFINLSVIIRILLTATVLILIKSKGMKLYDYLSDK